MKTFKCPQCGREQRALALSVTCNGGGKHKRIEMKEVKPE